jgi:hypothetical protein
VWDFVDVALLEVVAVVCADVVNEDVVPFAEPLDSAEPSPVTNLSPRDLMLFSNILLTFAFQSTLDPGTAPFPVKPMYKASFSLYPLSLVISSSGKQSLTREMEASPVEVWPLVSPQIP